MRSLAYACLAVLACLCLTGHGAELAWRLPQLEEAAQQHALPVQAAQQAVLLEQSRAAEVDLAQGARVVASTGLGSATEPVTDDVTRRYQRWSAQVGVRWPVLTTAARAARDQATAQGNVATAQTRADEAQADALLALRLAYVGAWRSAQRIALAAGYLQREPATARILASRTRDGLLLEADRMALSSAFETARRDMAREEAARRQALRGIAMLTGLDGVDVPAQEALLPKWDGLDCERALPTDAGPASAASKGALARLQAARTVAEHQQWVGVDAGVAVSQSISRDVGALSGHSTGVAFDVSMPLAWRELKSLSQAQAQARLRLAEVEYASARQRDAEAASRAWDEVLIRRADRKAYQQRLSAAMEGVRLARLRAARLDGDVLEKRAQAEYGLYVAAVEASQALERLERALAQWLARWPACERSTGQPVSMPELDSVAATLASAGGPVGDGGHTAAPTGADASPQQPRWSWFVWRAEPWLAAPAAMLAKLPLDTERIMVSLTAGELQALATPAGRERLAALLQRGHERGLMVELLLGEPTWVTRRGPAALLAQASPALAQAFDGVVLDLERHQLDPPPALQTWRRGVVRLVSALSAHTELPISLVTHDRDLGHAGFLRQLAAHRVRRLYPMIYASRPTTRSQRLQAVADAVSRAGLTARLHVTLAQSVERSLPDAERVPGSDRPTVLQALRETAAPLQGDPRLDAGLAIQSFEAFEELSP